jgi:hypothetical protein
VYVTRSLSLRFQQRWYRGSVFRAAAIAALLSACGSPDPSTIGESIAADLDSLNGPPTLVVNAFWCDYRTEECLPGSGTQGTSPLDATPLAGGLARARGIPLVDVEEVGPPVCAWTKDREGARGLYAQFLRPPIVEADSARVELATGCGDNHGAAFEQIHEFVLRRDGRGWIVVRRTLTSIT